MTELLADGMITTGFSNPYVALYGETAGVISYTKGQKLARGVDVSLEPKVSDVSKFYADNIEAETAGGEITGGKVTIHVDGLLTAAERLIMGLAAVNTDGWYAYNDDGIAPFCGFGYITRYKSNGLVKYQATVIKKLKFEPIKKSAAAQEDAIDWQNEELIGDMFMPGDAKHSWIEVSEIQDTEEAAVALLKTKLGISSVGA